MKPLRLTFSAFGPYAEEQSLDFTVLRDKSFFLIHGPTGSGKTTILDAMCFALYGVTSGAEREGKLMRSDHADLSILTEVTFEFALGTERYRVTRRPEQLRPKKRGTGTTLENGYAELWRLNGEGPELGHCIAAQATKVTEEVERLLGFRSDQFRQVILLPQGQFRQLLLADSVRRQQILEVLFQTEVYRRVEEALKEACKGLSLRFETEKQRQRIILDNAGAESHSELQSLLAASADEGEQARAAVDQARAALSAARDAHERARRNAEKLRERDASAQALAELEAQMPRHTADREALHRARQAAALEGVEAALRQREEEARHAERAAAEADAACADAVEAARSAEASWEAEQAREAEREEAARRVNRLQQAEARLADLDAARKAFEEAARASAEAARDAEARAGEVRALREALEQARRESAEAERLALQVPVRRSELERAERALRDLRRLDGLRKEAAKAARDLEKARKAAAAADEAFLRAREDLHELRRTWEAAQAAVLARELEPGKPCPVCGSTEHPQPAHGAEAPPAEELLRARQDELERLQAERDNLRKDEVKLEQQVLQREAEVARLRGEWGEAADAGLPDVEKALADARAALQEAEAAVAAQQERLDALRALEERVQQEESERARAEARRIEAAAREQRAHAVVEERQAGLPEELRTREALAEAQAEAQAALTALREAFERARQAAAGAGEARARCESAAQAAKAAAKDAADRLQAARREFERRVGEVFDSEEAYRRARLKPADMEALDAAIRRFEANLQTARDRAERAKIAAEGVESEDVEALAAAAARSDAEYTAAVEREARLRERQGRLQKALEDMQAARKESEAIEREFEVLGRLSDVASGQNRYRMTFQRYVLTALLDDVLYAATNRLHIMSKGRFRLERARQHADLRTAGGLDLQVYDAYTGTQRPVATLSGGESFLASLSLALGLADVVQRYSGGIRLETLFVDEGFGSLDPEALDLALRALVDLQKGGRLVGIISHVPELRERIDVRLEVTGDRRGSRARFVVP